MKIVSVVGARPQFIKHAALSKKLKLHNSILIHTGQHYDDYMSKIFFNELKIPFPDYSLNVGSGTHAYQTAEIMKGVEEVLVNENPDLVIVYGDTNSTLASALAAVKLRKKMAHVEAGLRMSDKKIPEEVNRVITDYCSDYLFCPTLTAVENLKRENITRGVFLTGDVMADALTEAKSIAEKSGILDDLGLTSKNYLLFTLHRVSNTDIVDNFISIIDAIIKIGESGENIVFPVHPRTRKVLRETGLSERLEKVIKVIDPVGYFTFLKLLNHASKVLTDSGGIQKESYILKVPCITLMNETPWPETVNDGWNVLVGTDTNLIISCAFNFSPENKYSNYFYQGACDTIVSIIESR
ncbi:MAG: UDP-N-acetylglucosamine 2-epimerase (non-hydrolyzing) [Chitinispirillaceae bacterium]|nr:UDP-N-acetylglucosamine 2-epimerase (non-hydrolyzing) [Chitinispirillaceae bacterium]